MIHCLAGGVHRRPFHHTDSCEFHPLNLPQLAGVGARVEDSIRAMEGVNGVGGGEPGNQPPQIRRRSGTPQGNRGAPKPIDQAPPDPRSTGPRNPSQPRPGQPTPMDATEVHVHKDNSYGSGYGNTCNNNHVGDVQPGQNGHHEYAEEGHYVYGNAAAYGQGYGGGGAHGRVGSYGEADGTGGGYAVEGVEGRSGSGGGQGEPSEKCMRCVHGIGVPMARFTTRAAFKGARCVACLCTIL